MYILMVSRGFLRLGRLRVCSCCCEACNTFLTVMAANLLLLRLVEYFSTATTAGIFFCCGDCKSCPAGMVANPSPAAMVCKIFPYLRWFSSVSYTLSCKPRPTAMVSSNSCGHRCNDFPTAMSQKCVPTAMVPSLFLLQWLQVCFFLCRDRRNCFRCPWLSAFSYRHDCRYIPTVVDRRCLSCCEFCKHFAAVMVARDFLLRWLGACSYCDGCKYFPAAMNARTFLLRWSLDLLLH